MGSRVLSVGQCHYDTQLLTKFLTNHFDAEVVSVATVSDVLQELSADFFDLVLVNRQFDADATEATELLRQVREDSQWDEVPLMLVSNFADAQDNWEFLGGVRGFGKAELEMNNTVERLQPFLGEGEAPN